MKFYIVDVFAEQKYQGNQLAVLVPDHELSASEMQQIAREINFSETTFILSGKQENGGYDVRMAWVTIVNHMLPALIDVAQRLGIGQMQKRGKKT